MNNIIGTYSGRGVNPLCPKPKDICIDDIAHALSNICRFNGHCREFYSVAQHCVYVAAALWNCGTDNCLCGLMHDASEAYLGDVITPIKTGTDMRMLYMLHEQRLQRVIARKFKFTYPEPYIVHYVDKRLLYIEADSLACRVPREPIKRPVEYLHIHIALPEKIEAQPPGEAKKNFLITYYALSALLTEGGVPCC